MFITKWLGGLNNRRLRCVRSRHPSGRRSRTGRTIRRSCSSLLRLEALEDRTMLTGFLVDTFIDDPSATASDTDGYVSLREAVTAANTNAPFGDAAAGQGGDVVDTITFDTSLTDQTIALGGAELTVSGHLKLTGLGAANLTISGNNASRVFWINAAVTVDISGVTITGGKGDAGGAIYSEGTLSLENSGLSQNYANYGGAICSNGVLDIADSVLSDNQSRGHGGAIGHRGNMLTVAGSTFSGNKSGGCGGAIDILTHGSTNITDSTFSNNSARYGGAIDNVFSTLTVANSALFDNSVERHGGAIYSAAGTVQLTNTTVSGNSSNEHGGGLFNSGPLEITNSTVTANRADADGDDWGEGGGLYNSSSDPTLNNTILAGNLVGPAGADSPDDIYGTVDPASSHNLIGDSATAGGLIDGVNGNIVGNAGSGTIDITTVLDPNLAHNGGLTLTHALVEGSLALNAGDNDKAVDADGAPLVYDQRGEIKEGEGFPRIIDGTVDIGAFEVQPQVLSVQIDVKPGSDPNSINLASNGLIAVAIFTTDDFDASQVDAGTVVFAGASAVHSALEDVDGDGDLDMVLHFEVQETNLADVYAQLLAEDTSSSNQELSVSLTGETTDDKAFEGTDGVDAFFSGKALRDLLDELALAGVF